MRWNAWLFPLMALCVWLMCVAGPIAAAIAALASPSSQQSVELRSAGALLATSVGWAGLVALLAMVIGWAPGRVLGRTAGRRGFVVIAAIVLIPICLPSYVVFYAWWQSWPADTALHRFIVEQGWMQHARAATLLLGLVCWSWPLVALCVAGASSGTPAQREEMLQLDGAGVLTRFQDRLRFDRAGLALGGVLVFLATINNTTCFDLAEVFTFANELRAAEALGAGPAQVLIAGAPAIALALASLAGVAWLVHRARMEPSVRIAAPSRSGVATLAAVWIISVALPMILFASALLGSRGGAGVHEFFAFYRTSLLTSLVLAAVSGVISAVVCIGIAMAMQDARTLARYATNLLLATWLLVAIVPGTILGAAIEAAYNRAGLDLIYRNRIILSIGHLAAFGFVAALLGRWTAISQPRPLMDMQRLDGVNTISGFIVGNRPRILAASFATFAIVLVLSLGEIAVTAQINPPAAAGESPLALSLLNDMHYQRPQTVLMAAMVMLVGASIAALVLAKAWMILARNRRVAAAAMICLGASPLVMTGCVPDDPNTLAPLPASQTFGRAGRSPGQFGYPRAIDVDARHGFVYVIDKLARVQRFSLDGEPQLQWSMPEMANGKPTGVSVGPDGTVFVADTHYFRVIAYDQDGNEQFRFGEFGEGPGQFIYTTDIAFGPDGRLYVGEYGGNDRVQVFSSRGEYLFEFGGFGPEPGRFNRPQSLAFNSDKSELFIADACNHRIVVTDPEGGLLRILGSAGRDAGQFAYPYSVTVLADGSLLVCEFGNNRVQRLTKDGACLGLYGGVGRDIGRLQYPWAVAATDQQVFVVDSGNNRVQIVQKKL